MLIVKHTQSVRTVDLLAELQAAWVSWGGSEEDGRLLFRTYASLGDKTFEEETAC